MTSQTDPLIQRLKTSLRDAFRTHLFDVVDTQTPGLRATPVEKTRLHSRLDRFAAKTFKRVWQRDLTSEQRQQVVTELVDEAVGYGPLEPLLRDPSVSEILVNGPSSIFVERRGCLERTNITFRSDDQLMGVIEKILSAAGRRISLAEPQVDAHLEDGSRVTVAIPPIALEGPCMTIRKFSYELFSLEELVRLGSLTPQAAEFLQLCVRGHVNMVFSGQASSGKTTLMNALASTVSLDERIVLIEETGELRLPRHHAVRLETRLPTVEGGKAVSMRHLLRSTLHMRPDRILVGEVRGDEALDMLQALNTGHSGSMTTLHANGPLDVLDRIATMALMSDDAPDPLVVQRQIRSAIDLIVHLERFGDGSRKVTHISEVCQTSRTPSVVHLFALTPRRTGPPGLRPTGARPAFLERLSRRGIRLPARLLTARKA